MLQGSKSNIHRWLLSGHPTTVTNKFTKAWRSLLGEDVPRIRLEKPRWFYRFKQGQELL